MTAFVPSQTKPYMLELDAGTHWACRCGLSANKPLCDGAHRGQDDAGPLSFTLERPQKVWVCGCARSATLPFCDGSHKQIGGAPAA